VNLVPGGPAGGSDPLERILDVVAAHARIDFRDYRRDTIRRRLQWRMAIVGIADLPEYLRFLGERPDEVEELLAALVVPVTGFFRDSFVFDELKARVLPELAEAGPVRAWVVGTATGEEAYTLAMILECARADYRIVASDIDERSLRAARSGVYPPERLEAIPEDLRRRFLQTAGATLRIADRLRDRIRFTHHDFMGVRLAPPEAVLASFDLVLCRNVLLYFDTRLRERAVTRLASAVREGGALVLGRSETPSSQALESWPGTRAGASIFRRRRET
jgi:two-component system CheB/CheR fusion protein